MSANLQAILAGGGALVVIVGAIFGAVRWAVGTSARQAKKFEQFYEDWYGEEARPGVPRRPGVMERLADQDQALADIKGELTTNGGSSLKDRVVSMDGRLLDVEKKVGTPVTVNVNPGAVAPSG